MLNGHEHSAGSSIAGRSTALSLALAVVGLASAGAVPFLAQSLSQSAWADEPQVAGANALTPKEQQALVEFQKRYRLDKGQVVKYIKPPFVEGRLIDRENRWKNQWENGDYQKPRPGRAGLIPYGYVYFERDGELAPPHHFCSGSDQHAPADQGVDVITVIGMIINVHGPNLIDPDKLLKGAIGGDWVIRAGAPLNEVAVSLGQILNRELGLPIELELQEEVADVVVVRDRLNSPFVPKLDSTIKLYVNTFQSDKGAKEQGSYPDFLKAIGQFIEPNMNVLNEVKKPPQGMISWHKNVPDRFDDGDLNTVLEHLEQQTGLKFATETRTFRKIIVLRKD